jgi:hypothetical protein
MTTTTLRPIDLNTLTLLRGAHPANDGMCIMEAVAFVAGEPHSDHPACASRVISAFLRRWNDAMNDEDRQQLKPLIRELVGSRGTTQQEVKRAYLATDWACRVSAPTWLRLAKQESHALACEALSPVVDAASARAAREVLTKARAADAAAGAAAADAADAAAYAAAADAAAGAAGLRPTIVELQRSALQLVRDMLDVAA